VNTSTSITPHSRRVFTSLLLAFSILITPIAATAGKREPGAGSQRTGNQSTASNDSSKATAKDVFVNPPVAAPPAGIVTATMTAAITTDADSDAKADPSPADAITYSTTITNNTGADVSGLQFTDTVDPHTTIISNSAVGAGDDDYNTIGNVNINVPLAQGVLANDFNPNTGNNTGITVSSYGATTGLEQASVGNSTPTAQGGTVTVQSDGSFLFDPKVGFTGTDTFKYASNQSGSHAIATVRITVSGMIWFIKNDAPSCTTISTPCGTLAHPFSTLEAFQGVNDGNAGPPQHPKANDNIFIYTGVGNYTGGVTLLSGQKVIGQGAPASIEIITGLSTPSGSTVLPATGGTNPQITNTAASSDAITLNDGNTVEGLTVTGATRDGIAGASHAGLTVNTVTIQNNTTSGLHLTSITGTVTVTGATISGNASGLDVDNGTATITVTNSTISGNGTGLDVNNGTSAISLNNTNTITANAGQRQVSIQNRPLTAGTIDVGAIINDSAVGSTGILINSNTSGTINFTGSQTLRTTTNTAVNLTTNTGTTVNFSGTLSITTTTGIGLNATGGGTLNVTGTANVTTGAAANGININGVTVGGSGATFASINTTNATTGISLTSIGNGNVTINGGTISGGTTGLSMSTLGTSTVALSGMTLTGSTTAISGSSFGTLTVSSVAVSGTTALSLNTGALTGTFTSVTSSGGTNGVSLTGVTGNSTFGTGSLAGASGATFLVSGGTAGVTYNGTIGQANAAPAVSITGHATGTFSFGGNITGSVDGADLLFNNAAGTYNFTATNTFTNGAGINITTTSAGTFSFSTNTAVTNGLVGANNACFAANGSSANVTYSGNLTRNGSSAGLLVDVTSETGGTITFQTGTLNSASTSTSSNGIKLDGSDGTVNFNGTNNLTAGNAHVQITNGSGGTVVFANTTTITNPSSSPAFDVSGGTASSPSVTYPGTLTQNTSGQRALNISGISGGTESFSGAIGSDGGAGVSIEGTGGTVNISGNMTLNNTASVFKACSGTCAAPSGNGLHISVTGSNNTVGFTNDATGPGVLINRAQIDAGGVTFKSVDTTGGTNGIKLDTTGTAGGFTIAGDGGGANNGSGGTIQTSTAEGILTNSTGVITLGYLNVTNAGTDSISVTGATGLTVNRTTVTDNGGGAADEGMQLTNISGTVSIANTNITNAPHNGIFLHNTNTNLTSFSYTNGTITDTVAQALGNDGILVETSGTTVLGSANISGSTFSNLRATGVGVFTDDTSRIGVGTGGLIGGTSDPSDDAANSITVQNNTFTNNNIAADFEESQISNMTFRLLTNTISVHHSHAVNLFSTAGADTGPTSHNMVGRMDGNTIGTQGTKDSGSAIGNGLRVAAQGNATHWFVTINNNTFHEVANQDVMEFIGQNGAATSGSETMNFKITNNTITTATGTNQFGGTVQGGLGIFVLADEAAPVKTVITGNNVSVTGAGEFDVYLAERTGPPAGSTLSVEGTGTVSSYIQANNTLNGANKYFDEEGNATLAAPGSGTYPLLFSPGGVDANATSEVSQLTQSELDSMVAAAIERWSSTGLAAKQITVMRSMRFEIADLPGEYLGEAHGNRILVDSDAGGRGWYVDPDPLSDSNFGCVFSATRLYADSSGAPAGHVDLLTAIEHEIGHKLGLDDSYSQKDRDSIMYGYLAVGERRTPAFGQARNVRPEAISGVHHLTLAKAGVGSRESGAGKAEVRKQTAVGSKQEGRSFNHVRNTKLVTRNSKLSAPLTPFAGCSPAGINGGGTAICVELPTIHNGESITISFQVYVNNPPQLSQLTPPQVSNFATVTGTCPNCPVTTNTVNTPVDLFDTTTTLGSTPNPSDQGNQVTFTATVAETPTQASADPTGTVNFIDTSNGNAVVCGNVPLVSGSAQCQTSSLTSSTHNIRADYSGDGNFDPSQSNIVAQVVNACGSNPVVTNTNDSGAGSLRDAITSICTSPNNNVTFNIPAGDSGHVGGVYTITLSTGELAIAKDVNITGPNSTTNTDPIVISGGGVSRVFNINSGKTASISGLTISNGNGSIGGGIYNQGTLTLTTVTVSGNSTNGTNTIGGGIANGTTSGTSILTITNSTISGNSANGGNNSGGGIVNSTGGGTATLTIINSTISGNSANSSASAGGGIYNSAAGGAATVTITNSTITGNTVNGSGGGISISGSGTLTTKLSNTIVAGNTKSNGTTPDDIFGTVDATSSFNLIGDSGTAGGLTDKSTDVAHGNIVGNAGTGTLAINTVLNTTLANNGGPTKTHALVAGSPAIEAGSNALAVDQSAVALTTDQRGTGFPRIADSADADTTATVDIGSYEAHPTVEDITDKTTAEDTAIPQFSFNIGDSTLISAAVTATSSNQTLIPDGNIVVGGSGSSRTLDISPAANANSPSDGTATITVTVTATNGRTATDTFVVTVTEVNDAPTANNDTVPDILEDSGTYSIPIANLLSNDAKGPANESGQTLSVVTGGVSNFTGGTAVINGANIDFTPTANFSGAAGFDYTITDDGTTAGSPDPKTSTGHVSFNITAINDAPAGTDKTVTTLEDNSYTFTATDFGFTDPNDSPANTLLAVKITTLPAAGSLTDNNVAVSAGQFIPVADINGGKLKFAPAADASGSPYASFTFQVQDNGGTTNGGVDLDQSPNTMTINVTAVNDAPAGADKTVTILEDNSYTFAAGDFGFTDPNDTPANTLLAVKITTLPASGSLTDNNVAVSAGQFIPVADITGGKLVFTPASNGNGSPYTSFTFQVQDDGGTTNSGVDLDQSPNTMTVNVTAVNDAPAGADKTVTILEDNSYTFVAGDFGFTDPNDTPANNLLAVKITTLPAAGSLTDNNVAVSAGQFIPVADITGGKLKFTPAADGTGSPYASFTFQVQDDGGTTNSGVDLDQSPNTMTINVTAVNDAPAGTDKTVTTTINTAYVFAAADFGFTDPNDTPANTLLAVKITTLPAAGSLTDNNVAVSAGQFIPVADINGGLLKFTPAANSSGSPYATFTFQVQDNGGTTNSGVDLDQSPNTMTINVGVPALSVLDAVRAEPTSGTANMLFTVVMNPQLASQTVTVNYATADQAPAAGHAASGTCGSPGVDYQPTSGTLTFNPGETTKTIKVSICSDGVNEPDETFLMNLTSPSGATISRSQATGTIKQTNQAGTFIISEIRTSGPAGLGDDFVELYNNTDSQLTVTASDASAGYGVFKMGTNCSAAPVLIATIPNGTIIPARGHYLLVGSQYSLANYGGAGAAAGDQTLTSDIESDRNVGLFNTADVNNLSTVTRLDAVGFGTNSDGVTTGVCDLLREGTNLPPVSGSNTEHSFFRKECDFNGTTCLANGFPKDTNDNNADFMFADTQGTFISGVPQALGAPGPQNKASGIQRNSTIVMPLLDSSLPASAVPNRDRTLTPNPPTAPNGVLSLRRRIQNNTGGDVTALRFRIIDITTFPSPGGGQADLRAITSSNTSISNIHDTTTCVDRTAGTASNCTVTVRGTTLETPPAQPNGGGFNSTLRVDLTGLPGNKLAANQSVEVQLAFGVVQGGHFRVLVNVEDDVVGGDPSKPGMTLASFTEEVTIAASQTINFDQVANRTFGDADFNVSATASSGLPVSYAGAGNCAVNSTGSVHLTGAGACTITASQAGDSTHNPATTQQTFTVDKATPGLSVASSLNSAKLTQNVTFTATVAPPANTTAATGTVQFKDNGVDLGQAVTLDGNGQATLSTASLAAGSHSITVQYSGNSNFNASSSSLAQVVTNRPLVNFAVANYDAKQSDGFVRILVNRTGDLSVPVTADYVTDGSTSGNCAALRGVASLRCDVTAMYGTFRFAAGETQKTLDIPINQDSYRQGPETFTVTLSNVTGTDALLVTPAAANITIDDAASPTPNAIDDTTIFVRQQYHDFLNREPDAAGLAFWKNNIDVCNTDATEAARYGGVGACIEAKRVYTSGAFFLSIEFRGTGGLVRDFYVAALDRPASGNMPGFTEFTRDTQAVQAGVVVGQSDWQRTLDVNRAAFMADFVMRPEFVGLYSTGDTPSQYVDKLYSHANATPDAAERNAAIAEFGNASTASDPGARGRALLRITQNAAFQSRELNRGFVQMQYFGYLRRNANEDPDSNLNGFNFWLTKLNQFNGDYVAAEMVKAFLSSGEYRQRFGTP
jgi:hypothetical protein